MQRIIKLLAVFSLVLLTGFALQAQPGGEDRRLGGNQNFERIKSARQAFITERLELTEAEAADFFPVFWEYEEQLHALMQEGKSDRKERRQRDNTEEPEPVSEADARRQIEAQLDRMDRMHTIKTNSTRAYLKILPAAKLIGLESANRDFRRELVERLRQRRGERGRRSNDDRGE